MSPEPPPQEEQPPLSDDEFLSLPQFNQTFTLQPTPENGLTGPFTLSYASIGDSSSQNVLLFFAPLMGSRLLHTPKHALASKLNLHILAVDRPGVGGTSPAAAPLRLGIMRVAIPALLSHLGISHVSIAAHSGGTIYALDFALENGDFLFGGHDGGVEGGDGGDDGREKGYIALGCPWILPSRTGSAMLNVVGMLPKGMILQTGTLARFIATKAGPAMGMGYAAVGKVVAASGGLVKVVSGSALTSSSDAVEGRERNEEFEFEERIWGRLIRKMFEEGVDGISEDAVLFMKKGEDSGWGEWGDYDVLVPRLVEGLRARGKKLRVDVFYGEKDHMIGNAGSKGSVWFDGCWTGGEYADVVEFQSKTAKGADHDSIWSMEWDVAREVMERVARKRGN